MKIINTVILFFCLFFSIAILAQNKVIDSLKNELSIHIEIDSLRVNLLNELAYSYYLKDINLYQSFLEKTEANLKTTDYERGETRDLSIKRSLRLMKGDYQVSIHYFKDALQLYQGINFKKGISNCYAALGVIAHNQNDYKKSIDYLDKAVRINEEIGDYKGIPDDLNLLGFLYLKIGNYSKSLQYYEKALKLFEVQNNQKGISRCIGNIGDIYKRQGNYPLALEYLNNALFLKEKYRDSIGVYSILNTIGVIYEREGFPDKSLEYYNRALNINIKNNNRSGISRTNIGIGTLFISKKEYTKAFIFLNRALEVSEEINDLEMVAVCLNYIGSIYLSQEKLTLALECYRKAENISLKSGNQSALSKSYRGLANIFLGEKKYKKALSYALKSKEIADKLNSLSHQINAEYLLFTIYKNTRDYKNALVSHEEYKRVSDSLFNKENIQKITQLEYEYKYKEALNSASIRELKLTKTINTTSENLEKSQRNLLLGVIAFLTMILILGTMIFFLKLGHAKSKTQNIEIEQKLLRSQMTPHFIFNSLSVLQGMILNKENQKSVLYLSKFSKLLRITLENSRDKMVPLFEELKAVNNYLELQNLEVSQSYEYTILVDETIDTALFEIPPMLIQPFIENAIEHGFKNQKENRKIDVQLNFSNKELICTIIDNGIGINAEKEHKKEYKKEYKKSLATTITSERLKSLSKDFKIKGSIIIEDRQKYKEQGTIVTLLIPYKIQVS